MDSVIQLRRDVPEGEGEARFGPGAIVRHRRYRYRGVVVAVDPRCRAAEDWYQSNQTQPARDQPWYHVLVDEAGHSTYVAQENLSPDPTGAPVSHPLLDHYFDGHENGSHRRNGREWGA